MRVVQKDGSIAAMSALLRRFRQCRPGYRFIRSDVMGDVLVVLADGTAMSLDCMSSVIQQEGKESEPD
jgi:hypothetical protein